MTASTLQLASVLSGVHVALVTPLRADDRKCLRSSVDFQALEKLLDRLLDCDIQGVVPVGTTGQSPTLTREQHLEVVRFVIEKVQGRVLVTAGAGSNCTREAIDLVQAIQKIKAGTPCLSLTGYYNNPPQEGLLRHFQVLLEECEAPLVLYNMPGRTRSYLEPSTIVDLAAYPLVLGIKQGVDFCTPGKHRDDTIEVLERTRGMDFAVLSGEDDAFAELLALGGHGIVAATANLPVAARLYRQMWKAWQERGIEAAREVDERLAPLVAFSFCRKNPIPLTSLLGSPLLLPLVGIEETKGGREELEAFRTFLRGQNLSEVGE